MLACGIVQEKMEVTPPKKLSELFIGFLAIGARSFGGVMPWAHRTMVEERRWLTQADFAETIGLCQFLPGPNIGNASIVLGKRWFGVTGAIVAFLGLMALPFIWVMALGVIAFGSIWPALLAAIHGFAAIEPRLLEVERVLGLARWQGIVKISLPSATPDILAGLRLGLTVSLILAVVCEMIAGLDGLGQWVLLAARSYKSADIFAGVALLGAIGVIANATLSAIESRVLRWRSTDLS